MVEWGDPDTLALNLTNLALGIFTLVFVFVVAFAAAKELLLRAREKRAVQTLGDHAFLVPGLGVTMADGGEKLPRDRSASTPAKK